MKLISVKWLNRAVALAAVCTLILMTVMPGIASGEVSKYDILGTHGTAKRLAGRTVIVSIFASDTTTRWDFDNNQDLYRYSRHYERLGIALDWIVQQAASYGVRTEFVWNWLENHDLFYTHTFTRDMVNFNYGSAVIEYLDKEIDTGSLFCKYKADNLLYILFFNTPRKNPVGSHANPYESLPANVCGFEYVMMYTGLFNSEASPGVYAHEILHLYGVPDMYSRNDGYNMSDKFIKAYKKKYPRDIMAGAASNKFDRVEFTFSPLTAYYAGLTSNCDLVDKWGLRKSEYILYGR